MLSFNKIADDDVIEVLNRLPFNTLTEVLFLLLLQSQLDEELLKFLIAEVNAELLEAMKITELNIT